MKCYYNMLRSIAVMAVFGLMASCTVQEEAELVNRPDAFNHYYATIEDTSAPDTKVYADEQLKVLWNAGDCISVFGKYTYNQEYVFKGQTGDNSGTFEKVENGAYVTGNDLPSVWAVYPYMETTSISNDGELSVVFPSVQSYADKTFGLGANVMVSATDDNNLKFRNAGGVLVIKLYGNGVSVNSVSLKGNKGEKIAGAATVTMAVGGTPAVVMGDQATDAITLACAEPVAIGSSADSCTEFWFVLPPTEFQDGITVSVNGEGGVFEKSTAKAISITRNHLSRMAPVEVSLSYPVPEAVDLGLPSGTFWASWNLGASSPKEKGELFAWGEYKPKKDYTWANYIWCNGSASTLTKYNSDSSCGQVDHLTYLKLEDDAAHILLGKEWRIPTDAEVSELFSGQYTSFSVSDIDGVLGYVITSKTNGNSIFVPMEYSSGNNWYYPDESYACWTSSAVHTFAPEYYDNGDIYGYSPSSFYFSSERYQGHCIRPVLAEYHDVTGISVDKDSAEVPFGSVVILTASVTPANATHKDVVWICDDDDFVKISAQSGNWLDAGACYASVLKPEGTATIRAYANGAVSEVTLTAKPASFPEPVKVDLGLPSGLKWASCNLGAQSSEDSGTCFAWGETAPKGRYDKWDYKYYEEASSSYSKYNSKDALKVLETEDDAASMLLGEAWRVPAYAEWKELLANCSKSAIKQNGVDGVLFTSRINGNCIFFPESISHPNSWIISQNAIWTASHDDSKDDYVTSITFNTATGSLGIDKKTERAIGNHIHPVYDESIIVATGIELSKDNLEMALGDKTQLIAVVTPENAAGLVKWSSDNERVATVDEQGYVTAVSSGSAIITASISKGISASCSVTVLFSIPEAVDLGLPSGVKWASFNLGATSPEESGSYYAWGETEPKQVYSWETYKWCEGNDKTLVKYNTDGSYGNVDDKTVLAEEDDAAHVYLGSHWRMPTATEVQELLDNCAYEKTGANLCTVRGSNGNYIIFPLCGYINNQYKSNDGAFCWTSTLDIVPSKASPLRIYEPSSGIKIYIPAFSRMNGCSIRPVYDDRVPVESITLSNTALELTKGDTHQLVATLSPANAYGKLIWSSSSPSVASVSDAGFVTAIGAGSATISATAYNGLSATCEITVARDNNALRAKWRFTTSLLSNYANYFGGTSGIVDKEEGFGGLYVPSNVEGNGKIEYYQIDKSAYSVSGNPKRMVGATGHPYVTGAWPGDYWLFSASDGHEYPAGTQLHIKYLTRISATGQKYWMLEYFDGEAWKQAKEYEVSTEAETGTSAQYNYIAKTSNETVECSWTLAAPCSEPKFRMRCVANWQSNGNGALAKPNGGTSRIADNDDDGEDAGPVLEVTSEP